MTAKRKDSNRLPLRPRDRGPSPFFHGREEIIDNFNIVLDDHKAHKDGTTFMIQGAPGAGKTALLDVLSKHAKKNGWKPILINTNTLWSPDELLRRLDKSGRQITSFGAEAGVDHVGHGSFNINIKTAAHTISDILRGQKKPLLLILDEAQTLGMPDVVPSEMKCVTISVLKEIHNGDLERPIMLLAGGLGTTESGFETFAISRFGGDCTIQLWRLDKKSECAVIRDWLIEEGRAKGDPHTWIQSIAEQAHGWPQHIISYIKPALKYIESNNRFMSDEGLELVLEEGAKYREEYYQKRVKGVDKTKREALAKIFSSVPLGDTILRDDIVSALQEEYSQEVAEELFNRALDQGIIDERKDGDYGIPIPSLHTWLVDEYVKGKS
ncbi:MAG: ATP-binding protein [Bacteroidetes bacterium]|nr:ATP-binding protein [Bacteroidota bacterium]